MGFLFSSELDISYGRLLFIIDICDTLIVDILLTLQIMMMTPLLTNAINTVNNPISNLKLTVDKSFSWLEYSNLKKIFQNSIFSYHLFLSPNGPIVKSSNCENLLGITIDSDFTLKERIQFYLSKS